MSSSLLSTIEGRLAITNRRDDPQRHANKRLARSSLGSPSLQRQLLRALSVLRSQNVHVDIPSQVSDAYCDSDREYLVEVVTYGYPIGE